MHTGTHESRAIESRHSDDTLIRLYRCFEALDAIDHKIIASGRFSTPLDQPLENIRQELVELIEMIQPGAARTTH